MKIQSKTAAEAFAREYGELLLLAGNTPGKMRTRHADLKILTIRPGFSTSQHFHLERESIYFVIEGKLRVFSAFSGIDAVIVAGDTVVVDPGEDHVFSCVGERPSVVLELESPPHDTRDKVLLEDKSAPAMRPLGRFWENGARAKVKICGVRSLDVAYACWELGVDAIGLHAAGPRWDEVLAAERWVAALPHELSVMVLTDIEQPLIIRELLRRLRCDTLQIQGQKPAQLVRVLAELARAEGLRVIKSVEVPPLEELHAALTYIHSVSNYVDAVLLDSAWRGGTGLVPDYNVVEQLCKQMPNKVVVAGGISEENITEVWDRFKPYGFDVESSVEWRLSADGKRVTAKSVSKISRLVQRMREMQPRVAQQ